VTQSLINLSYALQVDGYITISVIDADGRLIAILFEGFQNQGVCRHSLSLPTGLTGGMYFIRITLGGNSVVKKMMIL
jgi:hypothetical protein